ncbi:alpha-xylosidase [Naasia aerilata]|uniref:Alpha-xylosidase n=1 Tax=Naasia aerilata TaxID=1162966 RepID=A0ABM8GCZ0_9MICO|nr:alpha-xylosidase [Naasia aerilata]
MTVEHHRGGVRSAGFDLVGAQPDRGTVEVGDGEAFLRSGGLTARIRAGAPWELVFERDEIELTRSGPKSIALMSVRDEARLGERGFERPEGPRAAGDRTYLVQQLSLGVGELVYGLGERFGPLVKNGQSIEIWNADGGTSSEQAYKNLPFYISNRGYGVLVDHPGHVAFEIGSEAVERAQFAVAGQQLTYYVIDGVDPAGVLERYTALTGRPSSVPAWSFGTWLSTSFTTAYDEATVTSFIDGMDHRDLQLSVFHFDCFWMREFTWCDFEWDPHVFPDPEGMLRRLHDRGLKTCVWINPYVGQWSPLFDEARDAGYLLRRADGTVWQWDKWQAGMAIVDFTNPEATAWYQDKLRVLLRQGVDALKTDFGERIPVDVVWHSGADPDAMHNYYTQLYNATVDEVLEEVHPGESIVFARSATVGGQRMPVHWGGDSTSSFDSMAETLRGGLSLAFGGFGFWSHDIGGFEGVPDPAVFKRWIAFGYLSSHSRFHGSDSYRVPWSLDEESVDITRRFARLKMALMPYLFETSRVATERGLPVMRPMALAYPDDPGAAYLDRQYMLGPSLLVAPVLRADGAVEFYLPQGGWTSFLTGARVEQGGWRREHHAFDSLPLYVPDGSVIPVGAVTTRPDYDYLEGLNLRVFPGPGSGSRTVRVTRPDGSDSSFEVNWTDTEVTATSDVPDGWGVVLPGRSAIAAEGGRVRIARQS